MFLLDVNVLIALADSDHVHHGRVRSWFKGVCGDGWATCPLTENGFIRILSHPAYENSPGSAEEVRAVLRELCLFPGHQFWEEALSLRDETLFPSLGGVGSKGLTDIYLVALAVHGKGRLATLNERIDGGMVRGGGGRSGSDTLIG
jgi:toxin-antitoxin system PIN domain toxin